MLLEHSHISRKLGLYLVSLGSERSFHGIRSHDSFVVKLEFTEPLKTLEDPSGLFEILQGFFGASRRNVRR